MPGKHPANEKPRLAPMIGSAALRDLAAYGISSFVKMVEPKGFEPSTFSMPSRRAPNCATAPPGCNSNEQNDFILPPRLVEKQLQCLYRYSYRFRFSSEPVIPRPHAIYPDLHVHPARSSRAAPNHGLAIARCPPSARGFAGA